MRPKKDHRKAPRSTDPKDRLVRRAITTNADIIKLAACYWDMVEHMENMLEGIPLHHNQVTVNVNMAYKMRKQAKALGYHLEPANPAAFKTKELTDILYEQAIAGEKAQRSKELALTPRSKEKIQFS